MSPYTTMRKKMTACALCKQEIQKEEQIVVLNKTDYYEGTLSEYDSQPVHERCLMWYYDYSQ